MLPGVPGRTPTTASAGYRMPRERFFFYGIAFSATLHAAVLFGIERPRPPRKPPAEVAAIAPKIWDAIALEPEPPPPPPPETTPETKTVDDPANASESVGEVSRLPEPMGHPDIGAIAVATYTPDPGKAPSDTALNWIVPRNSGGPVNTRRGEIFSEKDLDKRPVATIRMAPRYPFEAKRLGLSGTVVVRFIVDSRGEVSDVEVIRSDSSEFSKAAAEAMLKWKFRPGMKNGRRVNTRMEMPMNFSLDKDA